MQGAVPFLGVKNAHVISFNNSSCYLSLYFALFFCSAQSASQELNREKENLLHDKEDISSLLSRRNDDLDRLTGELKALTEQLVHANKEKTEAIIQMEALSSKQLALDCK